MCRQTSPSVIFTDGEEDNYYTVHGRKDYLLKFLGKKTLQLLTTIYFSAQSLLSVLQGHYTWLSEQQHSGESLSTIGETHKSGSRLLGRLHLAPLLVVSVSSFSQLQKLV